MEPVELKIIARNETKKGLEEIVRDTGKVGQTVEQVTADFKTRMKEQSEVVKQVEADIKSLEKQLEKAAPGKAKMELSAELKEAKKVLAEEKGELAALEQQVDQSAQKHIALRTEIRNLKEQMAGMTEGTEEYAAAMQQLGTLQDRMGDVSTQGRIFADDNKNIKATMDAVSGLTGAMTAGVGVASLFGMEQEKLSEIQTKLQAVMAVTMGVQQVANTLNKDSYFTHVLLAKGKTLLTAANTRLAVSLGISNAAAKALMATLTLGLTVAVGALIYFWDKFTSSATKEQKKLNDEIERTRSSMEGISSDVDFDVRVAEAAGKSKTALVELRREAAKTALALADANFDKVSAQYYNGDATKEQLQQAKDLAQKAWDDLNKINQDATVIYIAELTEKKNSSSDKDAKAGEIADAELKARQKINDMTIALMKEGEEQKKKLARKHFDNELARIDQEERDRLKALQNAQKNGLAVTPEQVATVKGQAKQQRDLAGQQYIKDFFVVEKEYADKSKKLKEEEEQSWIDYNKEYGTYQEKRIAITKDYEHKIAESKTGGGKASLRRKMEEELENLDLDNLKSEIDWTSVFGNLDKVPTDTLKRLKTNLKDFIATQKELSPENMKELVDAIEKIDDKVSERNPFESLSVSFKSLKTATDEEKEAQKEYNRTLKEGTEEEQKNTKATLESAKGNKQKALSEATTALHKGVGEVGKYVEAGNEILGIMETLGIETPEWLNKYMGGVGEMLEGLSNIDLTKPMSIVTGGLQTIKGALTSIISLGGLIPGLSGADYSGYEKMKAEYDHLISIWDVLIDKKMKYIDIDYGKEALKAAEEAEKLVNIQISRQRQLIKQLASSGASVGSHSLGYRINKGLSKEDYQRLSDLAGEKITAENQLWNLSSEQIGKILTDEKLISVLDTVNKDFVTYLQNIADYGDQLEEIANKEKEAITGMGLDEFRDGYVDLLSDLDSTNEDFADNFEKHLQKAIFQSLAANKYKTQIQSLYDNWASYGKDGLTTKEIEDLRTQQQALTDSMLAERDKLIQAFGWETSTQTGSQSGRSGAVTTITEETAGKIEGIATSIQIHVISMDDKMTDLSQYAYEAIGILNTIAENTAFCLYLEGIAEAIEKMERDGVKMK